MIAVGPGTVVDRYVLDAVIGRGGMAVVYRAHHAQLGTPCAIKILMVPDATVRQRLVQEGRIQASLVHPNVVRVFDVVQVGDLPGLVMEWVDGPTLGAVTSRYKLALEQCDDLAGALLDGVGAAHARGLVHRDLKPGNVLLETGPRGVVPKVADFGLAKVVESSAEDRLVQTSTGALMGTPAYMSPEQIRDTRNVDTRTDIFSLGVILYELACGRRPFDQTDVIQLFAAIDAGKYPPPRSLRPDLPEGMERAIVGALQSNRDVRIPDCATLLHTWRAGGDFAVPRSATGPWPPEQIALVRAAAAPVQKAVALAPSAGPDPAPPTPFAAVSAGGETQNWASSPSLDGTPVVAAREAEATAKRTVGMPAPSASGVASPSDTPVRVIPTPVEARGGRIWVGVALVAVAGLAAGAWWWSSRDGAGRDEVVLADDLSAPEVAASASPAVATTSTSTPTSPSPSGSMPTTSSTSPGPAPSSPAAGGASRSPSAASPSAASPSAESRLSEVPSAESRAPEVPGPESSGAASVVVGTAPNPTPSATAAALPTPDPVPAGMARVGLAGDVSSVWLVGPGGNFRLPRDVPAGSYELRVYFAPDTATTVSTLNLAEGQSRTIRCASGARQCK